MPLNPISGTDLDETIDTTTRNDLVTALGGNDLIIANAGANRYDGGSGFDYLSYVERTGAGTTATHGANINYATMSVSNPWGKQDVLISVEEIKGSMLDDMYVFEGGTNLFQIGAGFAGSDTFIDQAGSNTWLIYREDALFGGMAGITVRLGSLANVVGDVRGTIVDGFGDRDKVTDIHRVEGTTQNDRFYGSILDDHFNGLAGTDFFNGGAGTDFVYMDYFADATQLFAVNVNLALNGGEVINDGLGNTETATSIEGIRGSAMDDTIKGDAASNYIAGDDGKDILAGRGGADYFVYGVYGFFNSGDGFGDTILDFKSGVDKIVLTDALPGFAVGDPIRFSNGSAAGSANEACFFFDAASRKLYLDSDGANGAAAAVVIARLNGVTAMTANDFMIVDYSAFWG